MQTSLTSDISIFKFAFVASDFARFRAWLRPNSWGGRAPPVHLRSHPRFLPPSLPPRPRKPPTLAPSIALESSPPSLPPSSSNTPRPHSLQQLDIQLVSNCLQLSPTVCNCLQLSPTVSNCLQLSPTVSNCLQLSATVCNKQGLSRV